MPINQDPDIRIGTASEKDLPVTAGTEDESFQCPTNNLTNQKDNENSGVGESLENTFCKPCALQFNSIAVFQIHEKLVHDQKQPKTEIEPENCDQTTDDIDNQIAKLGSYEREAKENANGKENSKGQTKSK